MKKEEYLKTILFKGKMFNIGINDAGQCYIIEYVDEKGQLVEECCYSYTPYEIYLEDRFDGCEWCEKLHYLKKGNEIYGYSCGINQDIITPFNTIKPCEEKEKKE